MKNYFSLDAKGKEFFYKYMAVYLPILIIALTTWRSFGIFSGFLNFLQGYLSILLGFITYCYIIPMLQYREKQFAFSGDIGEYAPKAFKWYILSIITLGIYIPWAIKHTIQFYLERISYNGGSGEFHGKPARLLLYGILFIVLFFIVVVVAALLVFGDFDFINSANRLNCSENVMLGSAEFVNCEYDGIDSTFITYNGLIGSAFFTILLIFMTVIFAHLYINWFINITFAGYKVTYTRKWFNTFGVILLQIILSIITVGLYVPAAYIILYRYILSGTRLTKADGEEAGMLGFDTGITGKGFLFLWGQAILTIITLGIYGAWAICKVTNWVAKHTFIEGDVEFPIIAKESPE